MHPLPQATSPQYKRSNKLHRRIALVTGGDSGTGRSVCYHFALEGVTVAFAYVKGEEEKEKDDTLQMLREVKAIDAKDPIAIAADLGFDENCQRVVD
ncbi:unnamed protein product [Dovyalis caffra]|uniref:Uncharacterized protein n=1 Tax=Dovyalis caffra TaxID=77055 RepID=A0AAV1QZT6_9ROSI|nr:unnamed protein product [Dovyalis caffra]